MTKMIKVNGKAVPVLTKGMSVKAVTAAFAKADKANKPAAKAPAAPKKSDVISSVKQTTSGTPHVVISAPGNDPVLIPQVRFTGNITKLAVVGGSLKAVAAAYKAQPKPDARLANGITGRDAPHASKAVADRRVADKADKVGTAKAIATKALGKPKATATPKDAEATPKTPAAGPDRKYKATKKPDTSKPDSFRNYMISTIRAHGSTNPAKAAHAASGKFSHERLNFKWAHDNGYIVIADLA